MPTFVLYTNLSKEKIPEGFLLDASKFIAQRLGKPEGYVTVRIHPDQMMSHGGSTDACASVELYSIGALGEKNPEHSREIAAFIEEKLAISKDRFYITLVDLDKGNIALGGKTFTEIFAARK